MKFPWIAAVGGFLLLCGEVIPLGAQTSEATAPTMPSPWERLEHRLRIADWFGALELAEMLDQSPQEKLPRQRALVDVALYRGKLVSGAAESAVLPFLRLQRNRDAVASLAHLQNGKLWSEEESRSLVSPRLAPVFFDRLSSSAAYKSLLEFADQNRDDLPDGWAIYAAGLAVAFDQFDQFQQDPRWASWGAGQEPPRQLWQRIFTAASLLSQDQPADADKALIPLSDIAKQPVELATIAYFRAVAKDRLPESLPMDRLFHWLQLTAEWRDEFPEIAAVGLFRAATIAAQLGRNQEADQMLTELGFSYPDTYHGKMARTR